ncbi:MAG: pyrroline-5-carboxylate reductase [Defluviitaleaceae bacterium]|nr:pyrroline-5-carboxylate reductase [Defluviitaleaceae bacterium]
MIGFIGYGNMSKAMIGGLVDAQAFDLEYIIVSGRSDKHLTPARALGVITTSGNKKVAAQSDVLIIAVKPHQYEGVIKEVEAYLQPHTVVVSIAAGLTLATLERYFTKPVKLVRTMPNTPAMVGCGMTAMVPNEQVTEKDLTLVKKVFGAFGKVELVSEDLIEGVIVTSGSAPAYVYMMIEAMIQGGTNEGMSKELATTFVTQAVLGATKMVMETGKDPGVLRDDVCSPNGTTIEAVNHLNDHHFNTLIQDAMAACAKRSREMSVAANERKRDACRS